MCYACSTNMMAKFLVPFERIRMLHVILSFGLSLMLHQVPLQNVYFRWPTSLHLHFRFWRWPVLQEAWRGVQRTLISRFFPACTLLSVAPELEVKRIAVLNLLCFNSLWHRRVGSVLFPVGVCRYFALDAVNKFIECNPCGLQSPW